MRPQLARISSKVAPALLQLAENPDMVLNVILMHSYHVVFSLSAEFYFSLIKSE